MGPRAHLARILGLVGYCVLSLCLKAEDTSARITIHIERDQGRWKSAPGGEQKVRHWG